MKRKGLLAGLAAGLMMATAAQAIAAPVFNRVASFPVELNSPEAETTSSEIIAAAEDGMTLVYSDSPAGGIGFVDITDAKAMEYSMIGLTYTPPNRLDKNLSPQSWAR